MIGTDGHLACGFWFNSHLSHSNVPTIGNPPVVGVNRLTTHQKTMWRSWCQTLGEGLENPVPLIQHIESDAGSLTSSTESFSHFICQT
jgi:hypothetical protein